MNDFTYTPSRPSLQVALDAMKRERKRNANLVARADELQAAYLSGSGVAVFDILRYAFDPEGS